MGTKKTPRPDTAPIQFSGAWGAPAIQPTLPSLVVRARVEARSK